MLTVVSHIYAMDGIYSKQLDDISVKIWNQCIKRDIVISDKYLPWCENKNTDSFSRQFADPTAWMLKHNVFSEIWKHFFSRCIYRSFASRINKQLDKFISRNFDPYANNVDAFIVSCSKYKSRYFSIF